MNSASSWRTTPLPPDWPALRALVLDRDGHRCTWTEAAARCPEPATDVDHTGGADDHRPEVLRSLCGWHHRRVTAQQAAVARAAFPRAKRASEKHPGLV